MHLAQLVAIVATGDLSSICDLGSGTCTDELRASDPSLRPDLPPDVVGIAMLQPARRADGLWDAGGTLLTLCGVDGHDAPYRSELLVFRDATGRLISINTLYWLGAGIVRSAGTLQGPEPPACPA